MKTSEGPFSAKDVAKHAGVSQATVSRVLNGSTYVNEEKRAAVLTACAELGFVPNGAARALTMRKTMTFGAVVPNVANDAFALSMAAFHDRIKGSGYSLLLTSSGYDAESELQEINLLLGRGIDGLMVVGGAHHPGIYKAIERIRYQWYRPGPCHRTTPASVLTMLPLQSGRPAIFWIWAIGFSA